MRWYQKLLFTCFIVTVINSIRAQNLIIGCTGNIGLSKVTSNIPIPDDYRVKFTSSGNLGIFLEKKIGQKSSLGIEALWIQIEGKEITKDIVLTVVNGQELEEIGVVSNKLKLHSSYIGIPIYYRGQIGKIGIKGGFQSMIFLFANSDHESIGEINGEPYEDEGKIKNIKFEQIDMGPKLGVDYKLNSKIRLRADYYHGLIDITSNEFPWERKNRQINLGIQLEFGKEKKER
jgi:hypothetical protein